MGDLQIRDLETQEAELAARFFHEHWRPDHIFYHNRELLLWQYHGNPCAPLFSTGLTFRAAFKDDEPVGVFGYMPFVLNRYGTREYGCHLSAWWVHPDHRRGPLALRLLHSLQQHSPFNACIAGINSSTAEKIYEHMSWVVVHNIPRLVYIVDGKQFASLFDSAQSMPRQARSALQARPRLPLVPRAGHTTEISCLGSFESLSEVGWDDFYWKKVAPAKMGPAREASYLRWRYGQIPVFHYDALLATGSEGVAGLLVYRVERVRDREEQVIRLVDVVAEPRLITPLVGALIRLAVDLRVALIDFFCTYPPYFDQVRSCGFVDAADYSDERYWCPYLFQPLDHTRDRLNCSWWIRHVDLKSSSARFDFCVTKGDYEFDRPN